jgi:hypothetical protein
VKLPKLDSLGETQVDISEESLLLHAPGRYRLSLDWHTVCSGRTVATDDAKAKFSKKSHTLSVTLPLVV